MRPRRCLIPFVLALCACNPAGNPVPDRNPVLPAAPAGSPAPVASAQVSEARPAIRSRQAEAQVYFDQAQEAAELRHREAMAKCETVPADQRDTCIASAEEGLLAEMRAARVEHDTRMSQPE
jgi:hypothetical protein